MLRRRLILNGSASETKENAKLREERDILRKAAKYLAEETRWWFASSLSMTTEPNTRLSGCATC